MGKLFVVVMIILTIATISYYATADPDMLQDVCVADLTSALKINGFPCKSTFTSSDFFFAGLAMPGLINSQNFMGSLVTTANVNQIPGLNTLGISMARIDFVPGGINPPHTHPRATEIVFVLTGQLDVSFITTSNVLISQTIKEGDVFVFPKGLVHFQKNNYGYPAAVISAFNSQLPGTQSLPLSLFASKPNVPSVVLAQAFQTSIFTVDMIKARFNNM